MPKSKELAIVLSARDVVKYKSIIERAARGGYNDLKFERVSGHPEYGECICPKLQLVKDLSAFPELQDIKNDVINGIYDDKMDEEDKECMRIELLQDNVNDTFFRNLGLKIPTKEERLKYL